PHSFKLVWHYCQLPARWKLQTTALFDLAGSLDVLVLVVESATTGTAEITLRWSPLHFFLRNIPYFTECPPDLLSGDPQLFPLASAIRDVLFRRTVCNL